MDVNELNLKQTKRQLRKYRILQSLGIISLAICVGCLTASLLIKTQAYEQAVSIAPATDTATKQMVFTDAVSLYPSKPEAYIKLLEMFNEDGMFEKQESEAFLSCYNSNHTKLHSYAERYSELHYYAGLMYVNGFEADASTKLRMALPFFEEAEMNMKESDPMWATVSCYSKIGAFYRDYIWNTSASVREVDSEQMQKLVAEIRSTLALLEKQESPDAVYNRLGFCNCVCNLLYGQRDTLAATVPKDDVMALLAQIYGNLPESGSLQKEQTKASLQTLIDNEEFYMDTVSRAYGRMEGTT